VHRLSALEDSLTQEIEGCAMGFIDRTLRCVECGEDLMFSADEQIFFIEKQFQHDPKHCKKCKARHVNRRPRVETRVICSQCGSLTIVPFLQNQGRPVLCRACFDLLLHVTSIPSAGPSSPTLKQVEPIED
jgi:CxxC-x17-CxxC domain-containing protein